MIHAQNDKVVSLFKPQSVATNGTATGTVNCVGFRYAKVVLKLDTAASTSNTDAVAKVEEGDTTSAFATHADLTLTTATPDTSNQQFYVWNLDLKKRKKFLKISYSPSASGARLASADVYLSRSERPLFTATDQGAAARVVS